MILLVFLVIGVYLGWRAHAKFLQMTDRHSPKPAAVDPRAALGVTPGPASGESGSQPSDVRPELKQVRISGSMHLAKFGAVVHCDSDCPTLKSARHTVQELPICKVCGPTKRFQKTD